MKNLLLFASVLFCFSANAQLEVYPHDFNADGIEGWTLVDNDSNGITWTVENNEYNTIMGGGEMANVLHLGNGDVSASISNNWAILPVQDMSFYTGTTLEFTYLKGIFACEKNDELKIYASTSPVVADMIAAGPIATVVIEGDTTIEPPVQITKTVEIPASFNVANIYFAIAHIRDANSPTTGNYNIELTKMTLKAQDVVSGLDDVSLKNTAIVTQNPVAENLIILSGNTIDADNATISIYNVSGTLVKKAKYAQEGNNVEELSAGIYFVALEDATTTTRLKFIKK